MDEGCWDEETAPRRLDAELEDRTVATVFGALAGTPDGQWVALGAAREGVNLAGGAVALVLEPLRDGAWARIVMLGRVIGGAWYGAAPDKARQDALRMAEVFAQTLPALERQVAADAKRLS